MKPLALGLLALAGLSAAPPVTATWSPRQAAQYLDARQKDWFAWPTAKAQGGVCMSCHTGMTYLLARPALRRALAESAPTEYEKGLLDSLRARIEKRQPTGNEPRASQSLGVETVLSALLLARETPAGAPLTPAAMQAFDRLWAMQLREGTAAGAWNWFSLELDPFEMPDSQFYGASLALLAVRATPANYRAQSDVKERIAALTGYLRNGQQTQPLHNRLTLAWASSGMPGALDDKSRQEIVKQTLAKQQPDGGWTIASLGPWAPHEAAPASSGSNGYATAFAAFALEQAGVPRKDRALSRALAWLESHQDQQTGYWEAQSMNKVFEPGSMQSQFMRDAATAFAALALLGE